jgi:hypothetical protein
LLVDGLKQEARLGLVEGDGGTALTALEKGLPAGEVEAAPDLIAAVTGEAMSLEEGLDLGREEPASLSRGRSFRTGAKWGSRDDQEEQHTNEDAS